MAYRDFPRFASILRLDPHRRSSPSLTGTLSENTKTNRETLSPIGRGVLTYSYLIRTFILVFSLWYKIRYP